MADTKANAHRRGPSSFIPIAMPLIQSRTSLSPNPPNSNTNGSGAIPDSSFASYFSSQSRSFSVGHYPSPQTSPNSKTTFGSSNPSQPQPQQQSTPVSAGKTTFKSLRSLLPFGPGKSPASQNANPSVVLTPKRSFSLGQRPGKEKDKGGDKKSKSPIPSVPDLPEPQKPPVLLIQNVPPPSEFGVITSSRIPGPPQLPPLLLQSEAKKSASLMPVTLLNPTSVCTLSSVPISPSRIGNGVLSASITSDLCIQPGN